MDEHSNNLSQRDMQCFHVLELAWMVLSSLGSQLKLIKKYGSREEVSRWWLRYYYNSFNSVEMVLNFLKNRIPQQADAYGLIITLQHCWNSVIHHHNVGCVARENFRRFECRMHRECSTKRVISSIL